MVVNILIQNRHHEHFYQLIEDGADIIDIGAESTKPFAEPVPDEIQIERLKPVLEEIKKVIFL